MTWRLPGSAVCVGGLGPDWDLRGTTCPVLLPEQQQNNTRATRNASISNTYRAKCVTIAAKDIEWLPAPRVAVPAGDAPLFVPPQCARVLGQVKVTNDALGPLCSSQHHTSVALVTLHLTPGLLMRVSPFSHNRSHTTLLTQRDHGGRGTRAQPGH